MTVRNSLNHDSGISSNGAKKVRLIARNARFRRLRSVEQQRFFSASGVVLGTGFKGLYELFQLLQGGHMGRK